MDEKFEFKWTWEYLVVEIHNPQDYMNYNLNSHGAEGWELVQIMLYTGTTYPLGHIFFKRIKQVPDIQPISVGHIGRD